MAQDLESRLQYAKFKDKEIADAMEVLERNVDFEGGIEAQFAYCRTIILNKREDPKKRKQSYDNWFAENIYGELVKKFGPDWRENTRLILKGLPDDVKEKIKAEARTSWTYYQEISNSGTCLNSEEQAILKGMIENKNRITNDEEQVVSDKVNEFMKKVEKEAIIKASCVAYECRWKNKKKVVEKEMTDEEYDRI